MGRISVLIADDYQLIRETWAYIINSDLRFLVVGQCSNGAEAIELTQKLKPEIVLLDINMSPTSGIEATEQIHKLLPDTGIIAVSMHTQPSYVRRILKLGAKGYVTKNSPQQELLDAIVAVNNGKRYICSEIKNIAAEQLFEQKNTGLRALSQRELQVIRYLQQGLSSKEISVNMNISLETVRSYRHKILKKLNLTSTVHLMNFINSSGLEP